MRTLLLGITCGCCHGDVVVVMETLLVTDGWRRAAGCCGFYVLYEQLQ